MSTNLRAFDEAKKLTLLDTMGQVEAVISLYFNTESFTGQQVRGFYIGTLLEELLSKIKNLIEELLELYEELKQNLNNS